jgi:hypothetical protein
MTTSRLRRSSVRFLVLLAATVSASLALTAPASNAAAEDPLPIGCNGFCGYGANADGEYYRHDFNGCGTYPIEWVGAGSWVNHSTYMGQSRRVAMYDFYGKKIYTTPYSPSEDYTALWTDVWSIETCVR